MKKVAIFYHRIDHDGQCSGAIIKYFETKFQNNICDMFPFNHNDVFPWERIPEYDLIYMVDIAIQPYVEMKRLKSLSKKVIWIDHHASAINGVKRLNLEFDGIQDTNDAAATLAWKYCFPEQEVPLIVKYVSLVDLWKHKDDPNSEFFCNGLQTYDLDPILISGFSYWEKFFTMNESSNLLKVIIDLGKKIYDLDKKRNKLLVKERAFELDFEGFHFLAMNTGPGSEQFDSVWDKNKYHGVLVFRYNGEKWLVSLYANDREDVDLSTIAVKFGGGGHRGAAGFSCDDLPFKLPKDKKIRLLK